MIFEYEDEGKVKVDIYCNGEYHAMMNKVSDNLDIVMNYTNTSNHMPDVEQNNHTIKERTIRATFQRLPYKVIPRIMILYPMMVSGKQLNFFPTKGGASTYYSLWMITDQTNLTTQNIAQHHLVHTYKQITNLIPTHECAKDTRRNLPVPQ